MLTQDNIPNNTLQKNRIKPLNRVLGTNFLNIFNNDFFTIRRSMSRARINQTTPYLLVLLDVSRDRVKLHYRSWSLANTQI